VADLPPRLKDLLGGVGTRLGLEDTRATGMLWAHWREIVGDAVADNAEPTSLRKGVLRVRTTSPAWAQELTYLASEIKARANALSGTDVVRELRVWTGPGPVARTTVGTYPEPQDGVSHDLADDPPADLETAFDRARRAWARKRSQKG
jgi:hypothetical protein